MSTGDPWGQIDDSSERDQKKRAIEGRNKRFTIILMFISFGIGVFGIGFGGLGVLIGVLPQVGCAGIVFGVIGIGNGFRCLMDLFRNPDAERFDRRERFDERRERKQREREFEPDRPRQSPPPPAKYDDDILDIQ